MHSTFRDYLALIHGQLRVHPVRRWGDDATRVADRLQDDRSNRIEVFLDDDEIAHEIRKQDGKTQ